MDSFARKLLDELTCRAGELGDELGISGVPSAEIYAEDIVLGDTVEATQNLMKTTAEVRRTINAFHAFLGAISSSPYRKRQGLFLSSSNDIAFSSPICR